MSPVITRFKVLVDFIKFEKLDLVTNLVFGGEYHDLTRVRVVIHRATVPDDQVQR